MSFLVILYFIVYFWIIATLHNYVQSAINNPNAKDDLQPVMSEKCVNLFRRLVNTAYDFGYGNGYSIEIWRGYHFFIKGEFTVTIKTFAYKEDGSKGAQNDLDNEIRVELINGKWVITDFHFIDFYDR
jgi:hypothetical protein